MYSVIYKLPHLGIQAETTQLTDGRYSVALRDTDSGHTLPTFRLFPDAAPALAYARKLLGMVEE